MSSGWEEDCEASAREYVRQALRAPSIERRERLLQQARQWIRASMDDDEAEKIRAKLNASRARTKLAKIKKRAAKRPRR
jgi:uncharacterized protein (DUF736 family)